MYCMRLKRKMLSTNSTQLNINNNTYINNTVLINSTNSTIPCLVLSL